MNEHDTGAAAPDETAPADHNPRCLNCGEPVSGPFCPSCGQATRNVDLPFRQLMGVWLGAFAAFDSRLLGTLRLLITRPGALTREFLAGRRRSYIHPLKLYLAVSLLLFLALGMSGFTVVTVSDNNDPTIVSPVKFDIEVETDSPDPDPEESTATDESATPSWIAQAAALYLDDPERFNQVFVSRLAKAIFLLVPVFALLLKVIYRRTLYVHHLVFSLHLHTFAFFAILIGLLVDIAVGIPKGPGNGAAVLAIAIYTFLALRRCFSQTRLRTIAKMFALLFGYFASLLVTMAIALLATSLTI